MIRYLTLLLPLAALSACTWETYQDQQGNTSLRPKYEAGARVVYEDGSYARDQRYNNLRPQQHVIEPGKTGSSNSAPRTHWEVAPQNR